MSKNSKRQPKPLLSTLSEIDGIDEHQAFLRALSMDAEAFSSVADMETVRDFLKLVADRLQTAGILQPRTCELVDMVKQEQNRAQVYIARANRAEFRLMEQLQNEATKMANDAGDFEKSAKGLAVGAPIPDNLRINLLDKRPVLDEPVVVNSTPSDVSVDQATTTALPPIGSAAYLKRALDKLVRPMSVDDSWRDYADGWNAAIAKLTAAFKSDFGMEWPK